MKVLSLFSGIGGLDLAAEWAGMKTVAFCEIDDYACKVLEKRWQGVPIYRDVRELTAERLRQDGIGVNVIVGGFPCQPHSLAGKRLAQDDKRDLWGECNRLLCEVRPRWAVFENVPGLLTSDSGRFFRRVLRDIAGAGFNAVWATYGANRVGALHQRERMFIIANDQRIGKVWHFKKKVQGEQALSSQQVSRRIEELRTRPMLYEPKLCRTFHGIPGAMDRLKCIGNSVVPQQAYPIFKAIMEVESCKQS